MTVHVMKSEEARQSWRDILDLVFKGGEVVIQRYTKPLAVMVNYDEWNSMKKMHADLLAQRDAEEGIPWEEAKRQMIADGIIDD